MLNFCNLRLDGSKRLKMPVLFSGIYLELFYYLAGFSMSEKSWLGSAWRIVWHKVSILMAWLN